MALGWFRWRAWVGFGAVVAAAVCVAGVALRDIDLDFAWQAWHFATSYVHSGVAGMSHLWHWAGSRAMLGLDLAPVCRTPPLAWQAWHFAT